MLTQQQYNEFANQGYNHIPLYCYVSADLDRPLSAWLKLFIGIGNSNITVSSREVTAYAIKVESRTGLSGFGTDYKLIVDTQ